MAEKINTLKFETISLSLQMNSTLEKEVCPEATEEEIQGMYLIQFFHDITLARFSSLSRPLILPSCQ